MSLSLKSDIATVRNYGSVNPTTVKQEDSASVQSEVKPGERIWTTAVSTMVASMMALLMGCTLGYPSPVLLELQSLQDPEMRFSSFLSGFFGASSLVGGIFGGPVAGWVADKWGRKTSLMMCGLPYLFGYFLIVSASITTNPTIFKALLLAGLFIAGIGSGWSLLAVPVYVGEISSAKLRGVLSSLPELSLAGGVLFVYGISVIPTLQYYHIALVLEGVILLYTFLVMWIPETPRWLLVKNKKEQAERVMLFLRGSKATNAIKSEMDDIESAISETPHMTFLQTLKEFRRMRVLVPVLLVVLVLIFQEITGGGSTVNTYAAPIFREAGVSNPELIAAFGVGGVQFIATAVGAFSVDLLGRKVLLIVSGTGMLAGTAMLGTHFYITRPALCANATGSLSIIPLVDSATLDCNNQYAPLAIVSLMLFIAAFAIGWGPVPWVILSEYLPLQVRGIASGIAVLGALASAAVVTGIYPIYAELVNPWFAWWTFSIVNLTAIVFVAVFIVETKGKSLEDIQRYFQRKYSRR